MNKGEPEYGMSMSQEEEAMGKCPKHRGTGTVLLSTQRDGDGTSEDGEDARNAAAEDEVHLQGSFHLSRDTRLVRHKGRLWLSM